MLIVLASMDAVLNIGKTIVGVGGLIFVHELGHFLVGRWCGVHAEAFSIGFGPVLLKWNGKPKNPARPEKVTEYRLSAVPLGGYVKFLGENPDERGERDPESFHAATYPRKVAIMLAGVTMNVIAAFVLFLAVYALGADVTPPVVGDVVHGMPAWERGIKKGDEIVAIDGRRIVDFMDVTQETIFSDEVEILLRRDGEERTFRVPTRDDGEGIRRIGVAPAAAEGGAVLFVQDDGEAAKAGFRTEDRIVAVDGKPAKSFEEAAAIHVAAAKATRWTVERGGAHVDVEMPWTTKPRPRIGLGLGRTSDSVVVRAEGHAAKAGLASGDRVVSVGGVATPTAREFLLRLADKSVDGALVVSRGGAEISVALPPADARDEFADSIAGAPGRGPVRAWLPDGPSPARAAGVPDGCEILSVDGAPVESVAELSPLVKTAFEKGEKVAVRWRDAAGREETTSVAPEDAPEPAMGGIGAMVLRRPFQEPLFASIGLACDRVGRWTSRIWRTLATVFSGGISGRKLSGPVAIAKGAYDTAKSSWGDLFHFLGMLSMNLAVLNVLPLPLLDGGQLAIHTIERVRGRSIPERVLEGVQWAGLALLLSLMVYFIRNDILNLNS